MRATRTPLRPGQLIPKISIIQFQRRHTHTSIPIKPECGMHRQTYYTLPRENFSFIGPEINSAVAPPSGAKSHSKIFPNF